MKREDITPELLRKLLKYEPETGRLYWLVREEDICPIYKYRNIFNKRYAGKEAFSKTSDGYIQGTAFGFRFFAHRVAWAMHYGEWPKCQIDHINGNQSDNRIVNLRDVSYSENCKNRRLISTNKTGAMGVYWDDRHQKWGARLMSNYTTIKLGLFNEKKDAISARKKAEIKYGFHPNHGR